MRKVYNKKAIYEFCSNVRSDNIACMPEDIYNKTFWKKINLNDIKNVGLIYRYTKDKKAFMQKFFPNKYDELTRIGDFEIMQFVYSRHDNKIHCVVNQNGERHFKLSTDNYVERIPEEIESAKKNIKKTIDGFYGFWFDGNENNWFITDKNKHGNDYKKIATCTNGNVKFYGSNSWGCGGWNYEDLYIL